MRARRLLKQCCFFLPCLQVPPRESWSSCQRTLSRRIPMKFSQPLYENARTRHNQTIITSFCIPSNSLLTNPTSQCYTVLCYWHRHNLFIWRSFSEDDGSSDYTVMNGRMISEYWIGRDVEVAVVTKSDIPSHHPPAWRKPRKTSVTMSVPRLRLKPNTPWAEIRSVTTVANLCNEIIIN
jgi:hypothetical protein